MSTSWTSLIGIIGNRIMARSIDHDFAKNRKEKTRPAIGGRNGPHVDVTAAKVSATFFSSGTRDVHPRLEEINRRH